LAGILSIVKTPTIPFLTFLITINSFYVYVVIRVEENIRLLKS